MKISLTYPVFAFKKNDNNIYVFLSEKELKNTNTQLVAANIFKNTFLIDSSYRKYNIKSAYKVKNAGFFGFSLLKKGKQILIDFNFEESTPKITFDEFKLLIIKYINKNKNYWKQSWNLDELINDINECSSIQEITKIIK